MSWPDLSPETIEKLLLTFAGGVIGFIGAIVKDSYKQWKDNREGRAAILTELREVGCKLACAAWAMRCDLGTMDRAFLEWFKIDMERNAVSEQYKSYPERMREWLSWSDVQLSQVNQHNKAKHDGKGTMLQRIGTPLLDARVAALASFDTNFQRGLLEVRYTLDTIDDLIDRSRKYFDWTFTLQAGPLDNANKNLEQVYDQYVKQATKAVDQIRELAG